MQQLQNFFEDVRDYELAYVMLRRQIADEYMRHKFVLEDERLSNQKERYLIMMLEKADREAYIDALKFLFQCSEIYYDKSSHFN